MKKHICAGVAFMCFVSGCAGSGPIPVARYTPADEKRNCASLQAEIKANKKEIAKEDHRANEQDVQELRPRGDGRVPHRAVVFHGFEGQGSGRN